MLNDWLQPSAAAFLFRRTLAIRALLDRPTGAPPDDFFDPTAADPQRLEHASAVFGSRWRRQPSSAFEPVQARWSWPHLLTLPTALALLVFCFGGFESLEGRLVSATVGFLLMGLVTCDGFNVVRVEEDVLWVRRGFMSRFWRYHGTRRIPFHKIDWVDVDKPTRWDRWDVQVNVALGEFRENLYVAHGDRIADALRERGVLVRQTGPGERDRIRGIPEEVLRKERRLEGLRRMAEITDAAGEGY